MHTVPLPLKDKVRIVTEYCLNLEMGECVTYADQFRGLTDACYLTLLAGTDGLVEDVFRRSSSHVDLQPPVRKWQAHWELRDV